MSLPIFIYNIPGRSVIDMSVETMAALARDHDNIVGTKDATARMDRVSMQRHACGHDFIQLSGEDATALGFNAHGGVGCISVTANVAPRLCAQFQEAMMDGNYKLALEFQDRLMPLHQALFVEPNPAGAKYALNCLGHMADSLRQPLMSVAGETRTVIDDAMRHAGLLN